MSLENYLRHLPKIVALIRALKAVFRIFKPKNGNDPKPDEPSDSHPTEKNPKNRNE